MKPTRIALFIFVTLTMLTVVCALFPHSSLHIGATDIQMPSIEKLLAICPDTIAVHPDSALIVPMEGNNKNIQKTDSLSNIYNSEQEHKSTHTEHADTYARLSRFYETLTTTDTKAVRVVHYGDSQIEGDRMTTILRQELQGRFGGGGVGLIPLHQTVSSCTVTQELYINNSLQTFGQGPARYLVYGPKKNRRNNNIYGPMGQVAVMNDSLCKGSDNVTLRLTCSDNTTASHFLHIRILREHDSIITLPDTVSSYSIRLQGRGDVYGISLEMPTGIMVDNIPMRGCSGTIFTDIDSRLLDRYFHETNTRLIILQFGGNVMPYIHDKKQISTYVKRLRRQIHYLRRCAPEADMLFIGPSDMLTSNNGIRESYALLPDMDLALRQMTEEEYVAYWSLFEAMGGTGSMAKWVQQGLAGSDGVHFTRTGANHAGRMLTQWIIEGFEQYRKTP